MNEFFEPPAKRDTPEPQRYRRPPWAGPPRGTLPGVTAFERILAQTDKVAVCATRLAAYPAGFELMLPGGGGGGGGTWRQTQWVWPLPPPGPVVLVCEWPAMNIPLTRSEMDAQAILDAATRAQVIFSDEHLPEPPNRGGGWGG